MEIIKTEVIEQRLVEAWHCSNRAPEKRDAIFVFCQVLQKHWSGDEGNNQNWLYMSKL